MIRWSPKRTTRAPGRTRIRYVLLLFTLVLALASPAHAECWWFETDVHYTTTYGSFQMQNGQNVWVPVVTVRHATWEQQCSWDDPIVMPPPGDPKSPYRVQLNVEIEEIDTTDPYAPMLKAEVWSDDPFRQPNEILLLINGSKYGGTSVSGNGVYALWLPPMGQFGDGTTNIDVETCDADNRCAMGYSILHKYTRPESASTTMLAYGFIGDEWVRAEYGHEFKQTYSEAKFSVPEVGQNSRVHLKENETIVTWNNPTATPLWNAYARSSGAYNTCDGTVSLSGWCPQAPP